MRLEPGSTFAERFRIVRRIGQGSMGAVFLAEDARDGARVALKVLDRAVVGRDPKGLERFGREALAGSRIESPHVVRVLDSGVEAGTPWLSMELVEGDDLEARIARVGPLRGEAAPGS